MTEKRVGYMMQRIVIAVCSAALCAACSQAAEFRCLGSGHPEQAIPAHLAAESRNGFTGAVIVQVGDQQMRWASDGFSAETTHFWIASISKALTATAAARLAERGEVHLDTRVGEVFPGISGLLRERTLRQLLAHRAGLEHLYAADGIADRHKAAAAIAAKGVPATGFKYSNDGYSLAAAMLEQLTGRPFEQILKAEIFDPVGMHRSGVWGQPIDRRTFASFPTSGGGKMINGEVPVRNYGQLGPSGIFSTGADLAAFLVALREGRLVSHQTRDLLWTPGWSRSDNGPPRSGTSYGLGWGLTVKDGEVLSTWHGGNEDWLRHNGQIKIYLQMPVSIVVLSNSGSIGDSSWSTRILSGIETCLGASG